MMLQSLLLIFLLLTSIYGLFPEGPAIHQLTEPVDHSEGPIWDSRKQLLYFVDIHSGRLLNYNFVTGVVNAIHLGGDVAIVAPSKTDLDVLYVANNRSVVEVRWDGSSDVIADQKVLTTVSQQFPTSRFNDGKADDKGRLWFGTMGYEDANGVVPNEGVVYKITKDNLDNPQAVIAAVTISNGLAWNKANDRFYIIDSPTLRILEFQFNDELGTIANPRVAFDRTQYPQLAGVPDGMTIDSEDNLWVALYNGGVVLKIDSKTGELLQEIAIPAKCVTSVMFGGPNLDVLFVTTSRFSLTDAEKLSQPAAGAVFAITGTGSYGVPIYEAEVLDDDF